MKSKFTIMLALLINLLIAFFGTIIIYIYMNEFYTFPGSYNDGFLYNKSVENPPRKIKKIEMSNLVINNKKILQYMNEQLQNKNAFELHNYAGKNEQTLIMTFEDGTQFKSNYASTDGSCIYFVMATLEPSPFYEIGYSALKLDFPQDLSAIIPHFSLTQQWKRPYPKLIINDNSYILVVNHFFTLENMEFTFNF